MTMFLPPTPAERMRAGVNLGQPQMTIGRGAAGMVKGSPMMARPVFLGGNAQPAPEARPVASNDARSYALADALSNPVSVESGSWVEALAEALAQGWRGREVMRLRESDLSQEAEAEKREAGERSAISDALENFDPANPAGMLDRLRVGAPEQALDIATRMMTGTQRNAPDPLPPEVEAFIATLPPDQQGLARLNPSAFVGGMMRHRYPAPQRSNANNYAGTDEEGWTYD